MSDPLVDDSWSIRKGVTMAILQDPLRIRVHATGDEEPFEVPPHWHAAHDEQHVVLKGRAQITQDGVSRVIGPEDGVCVTRRGVVHSLKSFPGEETIIEETTLPSVETTAQKILFFRNMFVPGMLQSFLGIMQIFYYGDAYPEFPTGVRWLEWLVVVVAGGWLAPLFGFQLPDKRLRLDPKRFPPNKKY
ncbi:hypothetical protein B0H17DRAFT_1081090 [Mycena rosella]|uniref:Uncharacterized protein n=1 Tax=Mycena rosella TaxID=1033263 RepID=A0AAD7D2U9_MYCRO|nr:hypothetical protein B0H17DRAFT_1081090 [Mycena rosella]